MQSIMQPIVALSMGRTAPVHRNHCCLISTSFWVATTASDIRDHGLTGWRLGDQNGSADFIQLDHG